MGTARRCRLPVPALNKPLKTKTYEVTGPRPPRFQAPFATGREVYTNFRRVLPPACRSVQPQGPSTGIAPIAPGHRRPLSAAGRTPTRHARRGDSHAARQNRCPGRP